jgi:hypothetical protein
LRARERRVVGGRTGPPGSSAALDQAGGLGVEQDRYALVTLHRLWNGDRRERPVHELLGYFS